MHVSFDLDGTIIDSRKSVQRALLETFSAFGLTLDMSSFNSQTLDDLISGTGVTDIDVKLKIKEKFVSIYDNELCTQCVLYPNVKHVIDELLSKGISLSLVTNKRYAPTVKILENFNLQENFTQIIGADQAAFGANKLERLKFIHQAHCKNFYIGDTVKDYEASTNANYIFLFASWGYESFTVEHTLGNMKEIELFLT